MINNFNSLEKIEEQESLTLEKLKSFRPIITLSPQELDKRPEANYCGLGLWVESNFKNSLSDSDNLTRYVHNTVIINGQFVKFCEEKNIKMPLNILVYCG